MPRTNHRQQPPPASAAGSQQPIKSNAKLISILFQALIMASILAFFYFITSFVIIIILLHLGIIAGVVHHRRCSRRNNHHYLLDFDDAPPRLSPAELKKIPKTRFAANSSEEDSCAICLEELIDGDWCRELPDCNHAFHVGCVDRWLAKAVACPVFRTTVRIAAGEEGEERKGQLWSVFGFE